MQDTIQINQNLVSMTDFLTDAQSVRLDGCPDPVANLPSCMINPVQVVYNGSSLSAYDTGLASYTGL
jgi:hypothetical protein